MVMWWSCDDRVKVMWWSCEGHVMVMWWSCEGHVMIVWRSCDGHVMIVWRSCDSHVTVMWWSLWVLWGSHDSLLGTSDVIIACSCFMWWLLYVCSWFGLTCNGCHACQSCTTVAGHVLATSCPLLDSSDEEVTKVLQTFLQTSTFGDFSLRTHLLRAFYHTPASKQKTHALNVCFTQHYLYHSDKMTLY